MNNPGCASRWAVALLLGGGGFAPAACVVEGVAPTAMGGIVVSGPPPAPMREIRPPPARERLIWVTGYWHWTGVQYAWIPGHWEDPRPGAQWRAPRYLLRDGVYYYEPGGWRAPAR